MRTYVFLLLLFLESLHSLRIHISRSDIASTLTEDIQYVLAKSVLEPSNYASLAQLLESYTPFYTAFSRGCQNWSFESYKRVSAYVDVNPRARWLLSPWCIQQLPFKVEPVLAWRHIPVNTYPLDWFLKSMRQIDQIDPLGEYRFNCAWWNYVHWEQFIAEALNTPLHRYLTPMALERAGYWEPQLLSVILEFFKIQDESSRAGILRIVLDRYIKIQEEELDTIYEDFLVDVRRYIEPVDSALAAVLNCTIENPNECPGLEDLLLHRTDIETRHLILSLSSSFSKQEIFVNVIDKISQMNLSQYDYLSVMQTISYYRSDPNVYRSLFNFGRLLYSPLTLFATLSNLLTFPQNVVLFRKTKQLTHAGLLKLEYVSNKKVILSTLMHYSAFCPYRIDGRPAKEYLNTWLTELIGGKDMNQLGEQSLQIVSTIKVVLDWHLNTEESIPAYDPIF